MGGSPLEERDREGGLDIIYSRLGEKADEVIKRLLAKGSEEIIVVTSDREIVNFAARRGKTSIASAAFASLLDGVAAGPVSGGPPEREEEEDEDPPRRRKKEGTRPPPFQTETGCADPDQEALTLVCKNNRKGQFDGDVRPDRRDS